MIYLAVALGGALGALSRFGIGQWLADSGYAHLHPATFLVNVIRTADWYPVYRGRALYIV